MFYQISHLITNAIPQHIPLKNKNLIISYFYCVQMTDSTGYVIIQRQFYAMRVSFPLFQHGCIITIIVNNDNIECS